MVQDENWHADRPRPCHIVLDEDPAPIPQTGTAPNFRPISVVAGWIKIAFSMEVGLDPFHIVLDGDAAPLPKKGARDPNFRSMSIVAKRLYVSGYHLLRR